MMSSGTGSRAQHLERPRRAASVILKNLGLRGEVSPGKLRAMQGVARFGASVHRPPEDVAALIRAKERRITFGVSVDG
jgi:hypothetical protein